MNSYIVNDFSDFLQLPTIHLICITVTVLTNVLYVSNKYK